MRVLGAVPRVTIPVLVAVPVITVALIAFARALASFAPALVAPPGKLVRFATGSPRVAGSSSNFSSELDEGLALA
eukprot:7208527-Alexandrium_andersonii.AAC.1